MSEFRELLDDVAREADIAWRDETEGLPRIELFENVLRRRLLPLLEAGQVMADEHRHKPEWKQRAENWRLAKSQAFGPRKNRLA